MEGRLKVKFEFPSVSRSGSYENIPVTARFRLPNSNQPRICGRLCDLLSVLLAACLLAGCVESDFRHGNEYLIRAGKSVVTVLDFKNAFEIAKIAYSPEAMRDPDTSGSLHLQILKQMSERLILLERAREIHIRISDSEVEAVIADIKSDYPEGEFENTLFESAISYDFWKKELKTRLIMEKVVARELGKRISAASEDMTAHSGEHDGADNSGSDAREHSEGVNERVKKQGSRKKTEEAYQLWIKELQDKYPIEINRDQWEKITALRIN